MRGEEDPSDDGLAWKREIPPRARRREKSGPSNVDDSGNTSACAEKSGLSGRSKKDNWKYLRVRGEESELDILSTQLEEIPPRARRRVPCFFFKTT